eukprot:TRINITY_DN27078_c0_g1_i1.p1 TRINITY_DN27078_c0_g1~~TRINITY_DN27078_c0_g1_i1.p1  ORF type:complete len:872 (-),score=134.83 TRINITY_DN27078_c0_g1_i1:312-2771(-)
MQKSLAAMWSPKPKATTPSKPAKRELEDAAGPQPKRTACSNVTNVTNATVSPVVKPTVDSPQPKIKQQELKPEPKQEIKQEIKEEKKTSTPEPKPTKEAEAEPMEEEYDPIEDPDDGMDSDGSDGGFCTDEGSGKEQEKDPNEKKVKKETKKPEHSTPAKKKKGSGKSSSSSTAASMARKAKSSRYDPINNANFKKGDKVPYEHLTDAFEKISNVSGRLDCIMILCNCFRSIVALTPADLLPAIYLSVNKLSPANEGLELGVGESLLIKAIAGASGKTEKVVKKMYAEEGDLGSVAQGCKSTQSCLYKPAPLTIRGVFSTFKDIAKSSGKDSMKRRTELIHKMIVASKGTQCQFVIRALQGKLRIGLAEQTVLAALSLALLMTPPEGVKGTPVTSKSAEGFQALINSNTEELKRVYSEVPSYDILIPSLLEKGIEALKEDAVHITTGLPVLPMLAKPTKGVQEVLTRFSGMPFTCEFKYDGERAQIHYDASAKQKIKIYSRNLENHTTKYPDLMQLIPKVVHSDVTSFILDSEVVAFDAATNTIKPFQALQHRGRKNIQLEDVKIPVALFAFDLLLLNGESLLQKPFGERRANLHKSFDSIPGEFFFATHKDLDDPDDIQAFLNESIASSCEGLMVKTLWQEATYTPSKRSHNWLKVKKDYLEGLGDSVDLVVIGGYLGKGKRAGWYGGFLLGVYDEDSESIQTCCKIGTGFSEQDLSNFANTFADHVLEKPKTYYNYPSGLTPDVWFDDKFVWEVKAADLSISPVHTAALGQADPEKGIALRFPRFIRVREDKSATQATSSTQMCDMYFSQAVIKEQA